MKKVILLIATVFILAACSSPTTTSPPTTNQSPNDLTFRHIIFSSPTNFKVINLEVEKPTCPSLDKNIILMGDYFYQGACPAIATTEPQIIIRSLEFCQDTFSCIAPSPIDNLTATKNQVFVQVKPTVSFYEIIVPYSQSDLTPSKAINIIFTGEFSGETIRELLDSLRYSY